MPEPDNSEKVSGKDFYYPAMPEFCISERLKNGERSPIRSCIGLDWGEVFGRRVTAGTAGTFNGWQQNSENL